MGLRFQRSVFASALAFGLALSCGSSKLPPSDPYTGLGPGGGTPGTGMDGGITTDGGFDAGMDAGSQTCDGGCLQIGQPCQIDVSPNGGCAQGLTCLLNLNSESYTCQSSGGDL